MSLTERKHCDKCEQITIHLKKNPLEQIEEECLPCGWYEVDNDGNDLWWEDKIQQEGFDKSKKAWEDIKSSDLNRRVIEELTDKETREWNAHVKRIDQRFTLNKKDGDKGDDNKQNQKLDYQPYLIGGAVGGGIIAFIWLIVFLIRRD